MGTEEYYFSTRKAVVVQKSTVGELGTLCWYNRALQEHWGGCAGTAEYYRSTLETVLVQQNIIGTLEMPGVGCAGTAEYYRSTGDTLLVQKSTIGALRRLCWYSRVL